MVPNLSGWGGVTGTFGNPCSNVDLVWECMLEVCLVFKVESLRLTKIHWKDRTGQLLAIAKEKS